ncbi:hypothetical protein D3C77_595810 [compost metagenome]
MVGRIRSGRGWLHHVPYRQRVNSAEASCAQARGDRMRLGTRHFGDAEAAGGGDFSAG